MLNAGSKTLNGKLVTIINIITITIIIIIITIIIYCLSCHPVAVVILHVYKILNWLLINLCREGYMKSLKWQLASWKPSQHLLIDTGKQRKTCVVVAGRRTFRILTSSQQSGI